MVIPTTGCSRRWLLNLPGSGEGQLPLALVHRAAGVERDDPPPAEPVEEPGQLPWGEWRSSW